MAQTKEERRTKKRAYDRIWRDKNRKKLRSYEYKRKVTTPERWILTQAKTRAKQKGLEFNLTEDDIQIPEFCPALGIKLEWSTKVKGHHSPSLDRIRNEEGYVKGNVQVISWRANNLKRDATVEEIQKLANFLRGA
ncbi:MAG: hypothetical protein KGI25_10285 [Thaumarchaeota archaeon]|nr:hypothetical protein [Nitrososphaerota archaeon]